MKRTVTLSIMTLAIGLTGCTTLEGVWADIKTAKPFKEASQSGETKPLTDSEIKALKTDMVQAKAIWSDTDGLNQDDPGADIPGVTQTVQIASIDPEPMQLRGLYQFDKSEDRPATAYEAKRLAKIGPNQASFMGAIQIYDYKPGDIYQINAAPEHVTDIALEPGEELISVSAGDTVRWKLGDTRSGSGHNSQVHILVKPLAADIKTNLIILTSKRTYYAQLEARPESYMPAIAWHYESDFVQTPVIAKYASLGTEASIPDIQTPRFDQLDFDYKIKGDRPAWRPVRAFDDGQKVYIQFPEDISRSEAPPLFVLSEAGESSLINYRVKGRYYVVDRLFDRAELRIGEKKQKTVRIVRDDKS